jgi:hypothetical protein
MRGIWTAFRLKPSRRSPGRLLFPFARPAWGRERSRSREWIRLDSFVAALKVGPQGRIVGVDMTDAQRFKAERLRDRDAFANVSFVKGYIEAVPCLAGRCQG